MQTAVVEVGCSLAGYLEPAGESPLAGIIAPTVQDRPPSALGARRIRASSDADHASSRELKDYPLDKHALAVKIADPGALGDLVSASPFS